MLSIFSKIKKLDFRVTGRAMRLLSLLIICLFSIAFSMTGSASIPETSKVIQVESFNKLKVGDSIDGRHWGAPRHLAKNYFYLLRSDLPAHCLNLQCGRFARKIMIRNGFLAGGADQDLAKEVGLDFTSTEVNHVESLLIVTDASGKVTHLYENIVPGRMDEILEQVSAR
jgi:hypothetical protein